MQFLFIAFMISVPLIPIEVMDYPFSDDPVYLVYEESESGYRISLGTDFEGQIDPMTDYVDYPGLFNPTKAAAVFDVETRIISVYSQYPYSANYYLATYRFDDDGRLSPLESGGHDYYFETLENIEQSIDRLDFDEVLNSTWSVMYPHANPYSREMCILLLKAGLGHAQAMIEAGESVSNAIECFDEINDVAWNLSGNPVHLSVQTLENYPEELSVSSEEYLEMLDEYADRIEQSGNSEEAENIRQVRMELSDD